MEAPDVKTAQAGLRALAFAQSKVAGSFTHTPPSKVDQKHATTITKLNQAIEDLGGKELIQESGGVDLAVETKKTSREELEALAKQANTTAGSIATEQGRPEIMTEFRMPHALGDEKVKARINAMAQAIEDLNLEEDFEEHGLDDFPDTLRNAAIGFVSDEGSKGTALSTRVGAGLAIPGLTRTIKSAIATLNAMYHNVFPGDAETLGAWKSASHIEKVPVRKPRPPKPPEGGTTGGGVSPAT
ncbi:MAG TPA: hypothetical protein VGG02_13925 [Chthoniobacterales bacterium]|jgi:hypothetical protein